MSVTATLPTFLTAPTQTPLGAAGRLRELDVLRGFALLGILVVNIESFAGPEFLHDIPVGVARPAFTGWHASLDLLVLSLKWLFVEGKMRALFMMLFGAGAVLLTNRLEQQLGSSRARMIYFRRNLWLLILGVIHGTGIWYGDIASYYAFWGLLTLWLVRRLNPRMLIGIGLTMFAFTAFLGNPNLEDRLFGAATPGHSIVATAISQGFAEPSSAQIHAAQAEVAQLNTQAQNEAMQARSQGYLASMRANVQIYWQLVAALFGSGAVLEAPGLMFFGMGLFKLGLLSPNRSTSFYVRVALAAYTVTALIVLIGIYEAQVTAFSPIRSVAWIYLPYSIEQLTGAIGNIAVVLLCVKHNAFPRLLQGLQAVGKTAFSNYVLTSVLCQWVFLWSPFALFGRIDYYQQIYVIAGVWVLNLTASSIWLKHFNFGPLEWAWRSLTYRKKQPMLRMVSAAG